MLTREKSKTIQQIKYILLLPVFLGMLFYTSCEKEGEMYKDEMMAVTLEDEELIEFSHQKIKQLKALYGSDWYYHRNEIKFANNEEEANGIKSKKAFFTARIANITYLRESQEGSVRNFNNMDREMKVLLPSSSQYEDYIEKYRAFKTLDPNLKVSITNEFTIRPIKKEDKNLGPGEWITVGNLNDLSGEEVLRVNQALESIKGTERYVALSNGTNMSFLVNATDRSGETSFFPFE